MKRNSTCFLISLLFLFVHLGLTSSFQARGQNPNSVVGDWTLIAVSDRNGRDINFSMQNGRLAGTYFTSKGEKKPISNIRFNRGSFYFDVPDLNLYFEMRFVKDRLEGKMTTPSTTEKRTPQPVRMTRRK